MPSSNKPICVVSGLGNGTGTGSAAARLFGKEDFRIALVSRPRKEVEELKKEIVAAGGEAEIFSVDEYSYDSITNVWKTIETFDEWKGSRVKVAIWNTAQWSMIPFLDIKKSDIERSTQINIVAATAFSQAAVKSFTAPGPDDGGTLIFTGATSALRGKENFGAFAAGKHGLRALSQSIAREYGPKGTHVCFVIIDGTIRTTRTQAMFGQREGKEADWLHDDKQALSAESIARTYLYLHRQTPDAWTLEMDLRPAKEHF